MRASINTDHAGASAAFDALGAAGLDLTKPMGFVSRLLEQLIRQGFRDERDPFGNPWPPHSPVTVQERVRRKQASLQMLIDSGAMYASIGNESTADSATAYVGTDYAPVVNAGNPNNKAWGRGRAPIPARPFFPTEDLPDPWWTQVLEPFEQQLDAVLA